MAAYEVKQASTSYPLIFGMFNTDGSAQTGLLSTLTVTISKNGAGFGSPAGAVAEIGTTGYYSVAGNATDTNTLGPIVLKCVDSSGTASEGSEIYQVTPTGPEVGGAVRTGTAQNGANGTITLDSGASATDSLYNDQVVVILSGLGAGQSRSIQSYVGSTKVATIYPNWATNPDSTSVFAILPGGQADVGNWLNKTIPAAAVDGVPKIDLTYILGSILTETAGLLAAGFKKLFNVVSPTGTLNSLPAAVPQAAGGLITSVLGSLDMDDLAADVDATETRVALALPAFAPQAAGGLITSTAGSLDIDDLATDVDTIETRVTTALPTVAPNAAGGLLITAAGSLDMDDLAADVDATETRVILALPAFAPQAAGGLVTSIAGSLDLDEMNTDVEAIQTAIGTAGAGLTALGDTRLAHLNADISSRAVPGDSMDVTSFDGNATAASNAAAFYAGAFTVDAVNDLSPSANGFKGSSALSSSDDEYLGMVAVLVSGALKSENRKISSYTGATRKFNFTGATGQPDSPFPSAPADGDILLLIGRLA